MKITIITVAYNSEKTIEETINSVINQAYTDYEYIIVDGGSKDDTMKIVEKYKSYISVIISEPDNGISDAFNKGIRVSTGELICIINSDDILSENALNNIANEIKPDTDVIYGNILIYRSDLDRSKLHLASNDIRTCEKFQGIFHPATLIRKQAYQKYGLYDVTLKYCMDKDIIIRMYKGGAVFQNINCTIARFSVGGASGVQNYYKVAFESMRISVKYGDNKIKAFVRTIKNITVTYMVGLLFFLKSRLSVLR